MSLEEEGKASWFGVGWRALCGVLDGFFAYVWITAVYIASTGHIV